MIERQDCIQLFGLNDPALCHAVMLATEGDDVLEYIISPGPTFVDVMPVQWPPASILVQKTV